MSEPAFRGIQDAAISGFSLLKGKEKREKISPFKYFFLWNQEPTAILLVHLPADTLHSASES